MSNNRRKNTLNGYRNQQSTSTTSISHEYDDVYDNLDVLDLLPTPKSSLQELHTFKFNVNKVLKYCGNAWNLLWIALLVLFVFVLNRYFPPKETPCLMIVDEMHFKLKDELFALRNQLMHELHNDDSFLDVIEEKIKNAINLYDADKTGLVDYAMESSGAWVSSTPDTKPYSMNAANLMDMFSVWYTANPNRILQPGTLPGQCFAFEGNTGKIRINLFHAVYVSAITLEHVHKSLALNRTGAPKDFKVYGLENESSSSGFDFGLFKYELQGDTLQTFQVQNRSLVPHKHVELHILNNHGNPTYTCIYRFRIHGNE